MIASCRAGSNGAPSASIFRTPNRLSVARSRRCVARTPSRSAASPGRLFRPILRRGDRALQVVDDRQELGGEVRDRVLPCVRRAALGPASRVLGVRQRPQQAIAQGGVLSRERQLTLRRCPPEPEPARPDFVVQIVLRHRGSPSARGWQRMSRAGQSSAGLAMVVVDFPELCVDHVGIVAGARTLSA